MKVERELCRERGPVWLHLHASCDVDQGSTMQSRSLDHVKDLVSWLVHLSETVWSLHAHRRVIEVRPISARTNWSCSCARGNSLRSDGASRCGCWCNGDWRSKSSIEHYVDPAGPFAQTLVHISQQVDKAFLSSFASRQPSMFPRHRWTGCEKPRVRRGRFGALHSQCLARQLSGLLCVVWCQARPTFRASVRAICGSGGTRLSSSAAPVRWL